MSLPRFVVLKSKYNNKYLNYIPEKGKNHAFVRFSGEEVASPYAKYELEMAKIGTGLVHIRSCYNNKYWVRTASSGNNSYFIFAGADKPEEDQSKWSCTLFRPVYVDGDATTVRFCHVQLRNYACLFRNPGNWDNNCVYAGWSSPNKVLCDVCTIIDWETLVILPKYVTFKGDNNKYLSARWVEGYRYLEFSSEDIGDERAVNQVFITSDGSVRIKSNYFKKFWRRSPNWIWADSDDTSNNNSDTLFWPVKVNNSVVALRNLGNNNFCARLTTEGKTSCLNANSPTINKWARLVVEEPVLWRTIYNVNYRLLDARTYNESVSIMGTGYASNASQQTNTLDVKISYSVTRTKTWTSSVSLKLGVKTNIKTGVPWIAEGKIEVSAEFTGGFQWGETESNTKTLETIYKVTVPPMTKVRVSMLATEASCDVPFSYSQRDSLMDGKQVIHTFNDGIFTGMNSYNFKYDSKTEPL